MAVIVYGQVWEIEVLDNGSRNPRAFSLAAGDFDQDDMAPIPVHFSLARGDPARLCAKRRDGCDGRWLCLPLVPPVKDRRGNLSLAIQ
jgi:hypothetical protein